MVPTVTRSTVLDAPIEAVWDVLRDFNGHDVWHPIVADSVIERGRPSDMVGCIRDFHLTGGEHLRERLLTLSDADCAFSYCLLETPVPLFNYIAHVRLSPVTDGDRTFWWWQGRFGTPRGRERELAAMVGERVYGDGMAAVRAHMGLT